MNIKLILLAFRFLALINNIAHSADRKPINSTESQPIAPITRILSGSYEQLLEHDDHDLTPEIQSAIESAKQLPLQTRLSSVRKIIGEAKPNMAKRALNRTLTKTQNSDLVASI